MQIVAESQLDQLGKAKTKAVLKEFTTARDCL